MEAQAVVRSVPMQILQFRHVCIHYGSFSYTAYNQLWHNAGNDCFLYAYNIWSSEEKNANYRVI